MKLSANTKYILEDLGLNWDWIHCKDWFESNPDLHKPNTYVTREEVCKILEYLSKPKSGDPYR